MDGFGGVVVDRGAPLGSEVGQHVDILLGCAGEGQPLPKGIFKPIQTLYGGDNDDDDDDDDDDDFILLKQPIFLSRPLERSAFV